MASIATATVLGGFFPVNGVNSLSSMSGEDGQRRGIAQFFSDQGLLAVREVAFALVGAAPGATATKTRTRVAPSTELGGLRAIETVNLVNRVTTAADVTEIKNDFLRFSTRTTFGATPPSNLDQNPLGTR
jgi:hypothetical protein